MITWAYFLTTLVTMLFIADQYVRYRVAPMPGSPRARLYMRHARLVGNMAAVNALLGAIGVLSFGLGKAWQVAAVVAAVLFVLQSVIILLLSRYYNSRERAR